MCKSNKKRDSESEEVYRDVSTPVMGQPENCAELINKYGTYEIQPTADSDNEFPQISQGLPKKNKKKK